MYLSLFRLFSNEIFLAITPSRQDEDCSLIQTFENSVEFCITLIIIYVLVIEGKEGKGLDMFGQCCMCFQGDFGPKVL